jgi:hypothetical protein
MLRADPAVRPMLRLGPISVFVLCVPGVPAIARAEPTLAWTSSIRSDSTLFFNNVAGLVEPSNALSYRARADLEFNAFNATNRLILDAKHVVEDTTTVRSGTYINEAYWYGEFNSFDITLGAVKENWGILESRDLVNNISSIDTLAGYNTTDRLPQNMLKFGIPFATSRLDLYLLGDIETRQFQTLPTRFEPFTVVDRPIFSDKAESRAVDFAARYGFYTNALELNLSYFEGINRTPQIVTVNGERRPFYNHIRQTGIEAQLIDDQLIYRFEAVDIKGDGFEDGFVGATIGAEYTYYRLFGRSDWVFTCEYHWDDGEQNAPYLSLDNYLSLGAFISFNYTLLSTLRVSASTLLDDPSQHYLSLEADVGLTDNLRMGPGLFYASEDTASFSGFPGGKPLRLLEWSLEYTF